MATISPALPGCLESNLRNPVGFRVWEAYNLARGPRNPKHSVGLKHRVEDQVGNAVVCSAMFPQIGGGPASTIFVHPVQTPSITWRRSIVFGQRAANTTVVNAGT